MEVTLLHHSPLTTADTAIGKCWGKGCMPTQEKLQERMDRVANKFKHASTIEHLVYSFDIDGISRACLQELARHRVASLSVKSTRYTLKELKQADHITWEEAKDYLVFTGNPHVDRASVLALQNLQELLKSGISNDLAKYALPESYKTSLVWTVNARSLQNFLKLRSDKAALWEIRELAYKIFEVLPEDHKFLFKDHLYKKEDND